MNPLISVIIPAFNRERLINECIKSVYNQNYRPVELVIVDDGSTDNTVNLVNDFKRRFEQENFKVQLIKQKNAGAPSARNKGFLNSSGEFIQFLDSDDLLAPNKFELEQQCLVSNPDLDLVYSKAQFIDEKNNLLNEYWGSKLTNTSADYFNFSYQTMCALYKREAINIYGLWNEELLINQDWEFSVRYIIRGANILFIDKVNSFFRVHSQGNIGKTIRKPEVILSKFNAHKSIYTEIIEKKLLDNELTNLYKKRFIYIFLVSSLSLDKNYINIQKTFLHKNFRINSIIVNILSNYFIASLILFLYNKILTNK